MVFSGIFMMPFYDGSKTHSVPGFLRLRFNEGDGLTTRSFEDRQVLGRGEIPLPGLLRATHQSGYRGAYTLEIFSNDVPDPPTHCGRRTSPR